MKASVLIATYNSSKTIRETLDSILLSDGFLDFEIVVSDDCSKDDTVSILREYSEKNPGKFHIIENEKNQGVVKNYFTALNSAKGEYIFTIGHDDKFFSSMLSHSVSFLEENKDYSACYSKASLFLDSTGTLSGRTIGTGECTFEDLLIHNNIPALTGCIRSSVFHKYLEEINPLEKDWLLEDYPYWLYISATGKIKFLDEVNAVYRVTNGSVMHKKGDKDIEMLKNVLSMKLFFADRYAKSDVEKEHFEKLCDEGFSYEMANHYLYEEDFKNFRKYLKISPKSAKVTVKYLLSLTPFTQKLLLKKTQY